MNKPFEYESTLTDRYQTTVPEPIRRALKLGKRDKIHYSIQADSSVLIRRATPEEELDDPVLGQFLAYLAKDMQNHPEHLQAVDADLIAKAQALVGHVDIDLEEALTDDEEMDTEQSQY